MHMSFGLELYVHIVAELLSAGETLSELCTRMNADDLAPCAEHTGSADG